MRGLQEGATYVATSTKTLVVHTRAAVHTEWENIVTHLPRLGHAEGKQRTRMSLEDHGPRSSSLAGPRSRQPEELHRRYTPVGGACHTLLLRSCHEHYTATQDNPARRRTAATRTLCYDPGIGRSSWHNSSTDDSHISMTGKPCLPHGGVYGQGKCNLESCQEQQNHQTTSAHRAGSMQSAQMHADQEDTLHYGHTAPPPMTTVCGQAAIIQKLTDRDHGSPAKCTETESTT